MTEKHWVAWDWRWEGLAVKGMGEEDFGVINRFSILTARVFTSVYVYTSAKTHQIKHLKWVHFTAWKLYVSKLIKNGKGMINIKLRIMVTTGQGEKQGTQK